VNTILTGSGPFAAADLQNGRIGYRSDTGELVLNIGGELRSVVTQPAK
jgi:hypothetical protein